MSGFFIHCFIKFGGKETINDLFENGTIYCNPVHYFRTLEDSYRGDNYEGAAYIKNYSPGQFSVSISGKPIGEQFSFMNLHLKGSYDKVLGNIYSLFWLSSKVLRGDQPVRLDKRLKNFGEYVLLVRDNPVFLERIEKAIQRKRLYYEMGLVEYYDKRIYTGAVDVFNKPSEYSYQNEFRLYIRRRSDEPIIFHIGNLKDIAEIYPSHEFIDGFEATEAK